MTQIQACITRTPTSSVSLTPTITTTPTITPTPTMTRTPNWDAFNPEAGSIEAYPLPVIPWTGHSSSPGKYITTIADVMSLNSDPNMMQYYGGNAFQDYRTAYETLSRFKSNEIIAAIGTDSLMDKKSFYDSYQIPSNWNPDDNYDEVLAGQKHKETAANALKLTSEDMLKLKLIDKVIKEPLGGAHFDRETTYKLVKKEILSSFKKLEALTPKERIASRREKFIAMGNFSG